MGNKGDSVVKRLLPYTFLCTIGPSVTAATALVIVRTVMCRLDAANHGREPSQQVCRSPHVGALTASVMTGLAVLDGVFSFFSTSYVQSLADRYGRRPLLTILPLLALIYTSSQLAAYIVPNTTIECILLFLSGVFVAANTKCIFVPTLSVADVADEQQRTRFYSRVEAVSLLGPGAAYVLSALSSRYIPILLFPFFIALGSQVLASLYAYLAIPETLQEVKTSDSEASSRSETMVDEIVEEVIAPVKPLSLLLPHRDTDGNVEWRLFVLTISLLATTCGTIFIATASLLYLTDKFDFEPEQNGWVLAYLTFSRFIYLVLIFPFIRKGGRRLFHWYKTRNASPERARLIQRESYRGREAAEEANHFDIVLLFLSICFDTIALVLVSLSSSYKQALFSFAFLALGAGDNPTFKSVITSLVPPESDSEALAAVDMVWNAARLLSPMVLGSLYAVFVEMRRPELLFLVAGGSCALGAVVLAPLVFVGRKN